MSRLLALSLLLLTGCAHPPRLRPMFVSDKFRACNLFHFCGEHAYKLMVGGDVCYGPDDRIDDLLNDPKRRCL